MKIPYMTIIFILLEGIVETDSHLQLIYAMSVAPARTPSKTKKERREAVVSYCLQLQSCTFNGETSNQNESEITDKCNTSQLYNLGLYLKLADRCIRQHNSKYHFGEGFTGNEEHFLYLLKLIALERRNEKETGAECFKRLNKDKERFVGFYNERQASPSFRLETANYWGTRQQMRAGKVIADWLDPLYGPIDPIFGILLCPTAGRTGPGDSYWMHNILFDQSGPMAFHSAVHDGFGYLRNHHSTGPGYNYLFTCSIFRTENPASGQMAGISFWSSVLKNK